MFKTTPARHVRVRPRRHGIRSRQLHKRHKQQSLCRRRQRSRSFDVRQADVTALKNLINDTNIATSATVQVPINVAATICDVEVNAIASSNDKGDKTCTAKSACQPLADAIVEQAQQLPFILHEYEERRPAHAGLCFTGAQVAIRPPLIVMGGRSSPPA